MLGRRFLRRLPLTDDEILGEIYRLIIAPLSSERGGRTVVANLGGAPPGEDYCYRTDGGAIPLYFSIAKDDAVDTIVTVHQIGSRERLDALPRGEVVGNRPIPLRVFRPDDPFVAEYESSGDEAVKNYTVYMELTQRIQARRIFEIGVRAGYSAYAMLVGAPSASYRGLDLNQGTFGGQIGYTEHAERMLRREFPDASVAIEFGDSQALEVLPGDRYDLTHVDGNHSHEGTLHDLELAARCSDWVLIDDVDFIPTVASALNAFLERHPSVAAVRYPTWRGHVLLETG